MANLLKVIPLVFWSFAELNADQLNPRLSFVNSRPQFNITNEFFALYIGVWRGFDADEYAAIHSGAALVSQREVRWEVFGCQDGQVEHSDRDLIWTLGSVPVCWSASSC